MDPRYPIGRFEHRGPVTDEDLARWMSQIEALPAEVRAAVAPLDDEQLDTRYRDGGWTLRQVVHHLLDSHLNSYVRFKWALTEEDPEIKTYFEERWAELPEYRAVPLADTLDHLDLLNETVESLRRRMAKLALRLK